MTDGTSQAQGWYHGQGDPPGTERFWDGAQWIGDPRPVGGVPMAGGPPGVDYAAPGGPSLASPASRIGGRLIDGLIWFVFLMISALPILGSFIDTIRDAIDAADSGATFVEPEPVSLVLRLLSTIILVALVGGYEIFMNLQGGTLGKRAIGAEVRKADGSALDLQAAAMRMVPWIAVTVLATFVEPLGQPLYWLGALAGLIMLFANSKRQTPWDLVGKTIVTSKS